MTTQYSVTWVPEENFVDDITWHEWRGASKGFDSISFHVQLRKVSMTESKKMYWAAVWLYISHLIPEHKVIYYYFFRNFFTVLCVTRKNHALRVIYPCDFLAINILYCNLWLVSWTNRDLMVMHFSPRIVGEGVYSFASYCPNLSGLLWFEARWLH
jgi:hypothetical protein